MTREWCRPMNVFVRRGSSAEKLFRERTRKGVHEAIVPGVKPTPAHDLRNHGGKTIENLRFMNFYVGADAWDADDIANINRAIAAAMSDRNLNNVMAQYFPGPISSTFDGSQNLPGPAPQIVSQGDVEQLVSTLYKQKRFSDRDLSSTVFNFLLPPGTVLNTDTTTTGGLRENSAVHQRVAIPHDEDDSLHGLGGYHGSVHVSSTDTVYYSIGAYSETRADGKVNGIPVFDQAWKNVVTTFYHELNEARTDADVEDAIRAGNDPNAESFLGWTSDQGEECGDFPVFEAGNDLTKVFQEVPLADDSGTVPVQFQYSNRVHGPEGPIAQPHSKR
ncbi:MAG TPA: hypothetical protein VJX16_11320 [Terriglobales bacterium]|nr:hypothetical protein [Terriglobales bacterium]